jgi:hypothetical protein
MEWTQSETLALAAPACNVCFGRGLRILRDRSATACNCVLRAIFRACFDRYRDVMVREKYMSRVTLDKLPGREGRGTWGRKDEEYAADFCLLSRRTLSEAEREVFRRHFLMGADWKLCCLRLGMDRGNFFHSVYRIEQKLGRAFRETEPYGLYPVSDYFHGAAKGVASCLAEPRMVIVLPRPWVNYTGAVDRKPLGGAPGRQHAAAAAVA